MPSLRPVVGIRFQILFHSPRRGSFHLSLTVLLRYRSSTVFSLGKWSSRFPAGFHVSCGTQVSRQRFDPRIRGYHPLWPAFPRRSTSVSTPYTRPYNPDPKTGLGSSTFARHYSRNLLFSSGYLDVSVHPVPSPVGVRRHDSAWVSPFGYFRLERLHTAYRNFSQCITSFFGT